MNYKEIREELNYYYHTGYPNKQIEVWKLTGILHDLLDKIEELERKQNENKKI